MSKQNIGGEPKMVNEEVINPCDNNPKFECPVNEEGRNRTCRKDGFCAIAIDDEECC